MKIQKKKFFGEGGGGSGGVGLGGQGGWERRSEACVKIQKKIRGWRRVGGGGQGGCEWRSEAFVKIQKKNVWGGVGSGGRIGGGGVRVDGNGELKLL